MMLQAHVKLAAQLKHILEAAHQATIYLEGLTKADFLEDRRTQDAVSMNLIVIGENSTKLLEKFEPELLAAYADIPWHAMRGMRNRMAHGYETIDFEIVWETVKTYLPQLITALEAKGIR